MIANKAKHQRYGAKGIGRKDYWIGLIAISTLALLIFTPLGKLINPILSGVTVSNSSTAASNNLCGVTKPLAVTEIDALGGSAFNAPTGTLYQGSLQLESPTFSSAGLGTTAGKYATGTSLGWQFSGASQATEFIGGTNNIPFLVPPMTCGDTSTNNVVNVYGITLAAYTIQISGDGGTTFTTGGTYYFSQFPGGASGVENIKIQITPNTKNQGYKASYDFLNGLWQNMIVETKDTASGLAITGLPRQINFGGGTTRYWPIACPDGLTGLNYGTAGTGQLTVQTGGNPVGSGGNQQSVGTYDGICGGSLSQQLIGTITYGANGVQFSFGVAKGSLASGSTETLSFSVWKYGDWNWYSANGVYGPNAAQLGAPVTKTAGTSFTVIFANN